MSNWGRSDELEQFKSQINLCEYASERGYLLDRKKSGRNSAVMKKPNGDKLIIVRNGNRHWVYFNPHDSSDSGTIIDFVQNRDNVSLGQVRKELRGWLGRSDNDYKDTGTSPLPDLQPCEHDIQKVMSTWLKAKEVKGSHPYLEQHRQIPKSVQIDPIFADRIRMDARGNALFPHFNQSGHCGIEIKNQGFTGFSPGGVKGLWCSLPRTYDSELWVCETAIDALSVAALFGTEGKRFVSTAGQLSPLQKELLQSAAQKLPANGKIVLAMDNDVAGRKLADTLSALLSNAGHEVTRQLPQGEGEDWNDVLRQATSVRAEAPTPR